MGNLGKKNKVNIFNPLDFEVYHTIGQGPYSRIRVVKKKVKGSSKEEKLSAWKIICKDDVIKNNHINILKNEIVIHSMLKSEFVTKFFGFGQTKGHVYLNLELCSGGELFSLLRKKGRFNLEEVKFYAAQVLLALSYLRSKGIVYRDLKPENILIGKDGFIKLSDFGCSKIINKLRTLTVCGTPRYMAPEIVRVDLLQNNLFFDEQTGTIITQEEKINLIKDKEIPKRKVSTTIKNLLVDYGYDYSVDYWSLGVLIYELISGIDPFASYNFTLIKQKILSNKIFFNNLFDEDSKSIITALLCSDKNERLGSKSIKEIFEHSFFSSINFKKLENKDVCIVYKPDFLLEDLTYNRFDEKERIPKKYESDEDPFLCWFDEFE